MPLPYTEFATWTLQDLAFRTKHDDRITFEGNHVSAHFPIPVRSANETDERFASRTADFWKSLPRLSDLSERLALAFEAFRRAGEKTYSAAHLVLKILEQAPAQKRAEYKSQGIGYAYKPIDSARENTRRGCRRKPKKQGMSHDERQAESIRAQASRFIRSHKNFDALFSSRLGSFRHSVCRDTEWYAEAENGFLANVAAFEKLVEPFEWWAATPLPAAAYFYHEQRNFARALVYYRKAITAARRAVMHEDLRTFVTSWMWLGVKLCLGSASVVRMPAYSGPWLPEDH
jgi:tetratricopeptide (TPR) repeat protein